MSRFENMVLNTVIYSLDNKNRISTDVAMMLVTLEVLNKENYSPMMLLGEFKNIYYKDKYNPNPDFSMLKKYLMLPYNKKNPQDDEALSSSLLLRIIPFAFLNKHYKDIFEMTEDASRLTNPNFFSKLVSLILVAFMLNLMSGKTKEKAYYDTIRQFKDFKAFDKLDYFFSGKIHLVYYYNLAGFTILETFNQALWSFLRSKNFKEALNNTSKFKNMYSRNLTVALSSFYYNEKMQKTDKYLEDVKKQIYRFEIRNQGF